MRKVEVPFVCDQRGDCCRETPFLVVSDQEADLLQTQAQGRRLLFAPHDERGFVRLLGKPCPFLEGNACGVYDIRPYNCRRFICGRPSGSDEPFEMTAQGACLNMTERLSSARFYKHAREVQAAAQPWALAHGWKVT